MTGQAEAEFRDTPSQVHDGPIEQMLQELYDRLCCVSDGSVATYIPALATARPDSFGLGVAAVDGHVYAIRRRRRSPFTIQSVVQAVRVRDWPSTTAGGRVLDQSRRGADGRRVQRDHRREAGPGRRSTPWSTPGPSSPAAHRGRRAGGPIRPYPPKLSAFAGRDAWTWTRRVHVRAGDRRPQPRHRLPDADVRHAAGRGRGRVLEVYFRQCSISGTVRDLAVMAATLANGGDQPGHR